METLARTFGAVVVFAEHRYFGKSIPYNWTAKNAYLTSNNKFLRLENVMMDYLKVIDLVRKDYGADRPVVTFGGSYGGMLATWMRIKFPENVQAAVASGAPLLYFEGMNKISDEMFYSWISTVWKEMGGDGGHG